MTMAKLITVERAKKEIQRLQKYVDLVEGYEVNSLEKWIIREYGLTNSIKKVTENAIELGYTKEGFPVGREYVTDVIKTHAKDPLHKMLQSGYERRVNLSKKRNIGAK
jgi:hypothetical protein